MLGKKAFTKSQKIEILTKTITLLKKEQASNKEDISYLNKLVRRYEQRDMNFEERVRRETDRIEAQAQRELEDQTDKIRYEEFGQNRTMILKALQQYLKQLSATSDAHGQAILLEEFLTNINATEEDRTIIFSNEE